MIIHFDGLDLAGKSTVCRRWQSQAKEEWAIRHNSITEHNPVYQVADLIRRKDAVSVETVGWAYHAALLWDLDAFKYPEQNTIQDSIILLRSLAMHKVRGASKLVQCLESQIDRHPQFDHSFVCTASHEVRLSRLKKRRPENLGPEDFLVRDSPQKFYEMEEVLVAYATKYFNAKVIDTSRLEDEEKLDFIRDLIAS